MWVLVSTRLVLLVLVSRPLDDLCYCTRWVLHQDLLHLLEPRTRELDRLPYNAVTSPNHHLVRFPNSLGRGTWLPITKPSSTCRIIPLFQPTRGQTLSYNIPCNLFRSATLIYITFPVIFLGQINPFFSQNRHRHASVVIEDGSIIIVGGFGSKFSGEIVPSRFSLWYMWHILKYLWNI